MDQIQLAAYLHVSANTAAHSPKQMNLLGLPSNVQRRIALLLEPKPDQAPAGTTITGFSAPDHASVGTSVPNDRGTNITEPSTNWKLSVSSENVASQLRQTTAKAVYTRTFGDHALQACTQIAACASCHFMPVHFVLNSNLSLLNPRPHAGLQSRS